MKLNERNIFLLDGVGALLSAGFTGLILIRYSLFLGLSVSLLQSLSLVALGFAAYSLTCYFFVTKTKLWMLAAIMLANLSYGLISLLIILTKDFITWRGKLVLVSEIVVVLLVVFLEFGVFRKMKAQK